MNDSEMFASVEAKLKKVDREADLISSNVKSQLSEYAKVMIEARFNVAIGEHLPMDAEGQSNTLAVNLLIWFYARYLISNGAVENMNQGEKKNRVDMESKQSLKVFINNASIPQLYEFIAEIGYTPLREAAEARRGKLIGQAIVGEIVESKENNN